MLQAFYSDKKKVYDISKVPDIYDSAKYDAIHNAELGLKLEPLYLVSCTSLGLNMHAVCMHVASCYGPTPALQQLCLLLPANLAHSASLPSSAHQPA